MVMKNAGQVPWALVLVALAAVVASGHGLTWAQAARNETTASANGEALDALLSTTSRAFSKIGCIEAIRKMKHSANVEIDISFPAHDTFIPPGAEAWCECLRANEPARGIPSDYEGVFNTCRDQVLMGSDYNAMDICRGMMRIFGFYFWSDSKTFCSRRLCETKEYEKDYYCLEWPEFDLDTNCNAPCMRELSAGYCAKYRLTYGGWTTCDLYSKRGFTSRNIAVDGESVGGQHTSFRYWGLHKVSTAQNLCDALYPADQGRCCTYWRGFATLSQCCYERNGKLEFNCAESYGGARLLYNCGKLGYHPSDYWTYSTGADKACNVLIDYYVAHPTYQQAKLAKLPGGQTSVVFPEAFMDDFCGSSEISSLTAHGEDRYTPGTREQCCFKMNKLFGELVENCLPGAGSYPSLGETRLPPGTVLPPSSCDPCSYVDKGNCKSVCKNNGDCTVRNGKAFCVRCNYFRQDFPDAKNRQCCELRDGVAGSLCRTKRRRGNRNKCLTNEGPWTNNKGVERDPQPYTIAAVQTVCNARENFWVNRKLCKVRDTADGKKMCKYISNKERARILAGR